MNTPNAIQIAQTSVITLPDEVALVRQEWITSKETELAQCREAAEKLKGLGATDAKMRRVRERINILQKTVNALKAGYIPIPRFQTSTLRLDLEELPLKAIVALDKAKGTALFDEIHFVAGREATSRRGPYRRQPRRDPLLVGIVRTPEVIEYEDPVNKRWERARWSLEEHFLIAWWRPEDISPEQVF